MVIIICVEDGFVLLITLFPQGGRERKAYIEEMEMRSLLATLGLKVGFHKMFTHKEDNPNYLIGPGQAEEAAMVAKETGVGEVVVDAFLTPRQEKNLEQLFQLPVVDRENVILSIFFQNAHSTEARLQIMKAQAEYLKPRLQAREENLWGKEDRTGTQAHKRQDRGLEEGSGETQTDKNRPKQGEEGERNLHLRPGRIYQCGKKLDNESTYRLGCPCGGQAVRNA